MRPGTIPRLLFIFYCVEAGAFLLLAPWSAGWERILAHVPFSTLHQLALHPAARGAVSGFGLIHLLWGAHDLHLLLPLRWAPRLDEEPPS